MGIPKLIRTLRDLSLSHFKSLNPGSQFDHVLIDGNSFLHQALHGARDLASVNLRKMFLPIVKQLRPRLSITIFLDGVPPMSKIKEQRQRRSGAKPGDLGPSCTVGTTFMRDMKVELESVLLSIVDASVMCRVSGMDEPGEGELKVIKALGDIPKKERVAIVSPDGDMVLLALMHFSRRRRLCMILSEGRRLIFVNLAALLRKFGHAESFAIVCMMAGNDYLRKLGGTTLDILLRSYLNKRKHNRHFNLVNRGIIHLPSLKALLKTMSRNGVALRNRGKPDPRHFLYGLQWCLDMYRTGECRDNGFMAKGSVFPCDILKFRGKIPNVRSVPASSIARVALSVMSPVSINYLLPEIRVWVDHPELKHLFKRQTCDACNDFRKRLSQFGKAQHRGKVGSAKMYRECSVAFSKHQTTCAMRLSRPNFKEVITKVFEVVP